MNYMRIYNRIIDKALSRTTDEYTERHHITPRCLGGSDSPENIVRLLPREHFVAHQLLARANKNDLGLLRAAVIMTTDAHGRRVNNRMYGWMRSALARRMTGRNRSAETCKKMSDAFKGRVYSKETRKKMSAWQRGRKLTPEHKRNIGIAAAGRRHTPESIKKMSEYRLSPLAKKIECPHCGRVGEPGSMTRWHMDNCRSLKCA